MDWGWIVLIVLFGPPALVLVTLLLISLVPLKIRVHAASEPREFEYAVAYGPFELLPDLQCW